jgi:CHASE1-domain containing sensor protein
VNARRHASLGGRSGRRLAIAGLFVLLVGVLAGWREYRASEAVQALAFDARFDQLVGATRMHFSNREAIALSVAAAFRPAAGGLDGRLEDVDPRLLTHIGDVFSMVWIARVPASRRAEAQRVLAAKRDSGAGFFGLERRPVPDGRDIVAVLDIAPRTPANLSTIGLALSELPIPSEALRRAQREQSVAATAPLSLVQLPGEKAIVLYVPLRSGT